MTPSNLMCLFLLNTWMFFTSDTLPVLRSLYSTVCPVSLMEAPLLVWDMVVVEEEVELVVVLHETEVTMLHLASLYALYLAFVSTAVFLIVVKEL